MPNHLTPHSKGCQREISFRDGRVLSIEANKRVFLFALNMRDEPVCVYFQWRLCN